MWQVIWIKKLIIIIIFKQTHGYLPIFINYRFWTFKQNNNNHNNKKGAGGSKRRKNK